MQGVVEGYTRHFFNLAHCLVVNDKEQPPRTLQAKMKELEKKAMQQGKKGRKRGREEEGSLDDQVKMAAMAFSGFNQVNHPGAGGNGNNGLGNLGLGLPGGGNDNDGSLLDRLQATQRRLLAAEGGISSLLPNQCAAPNTAAAVPSLQLKGRCIPGKHLLSQLFQ